MEYGMKRMYNWFQDLALNKKITYLIIVTGIIPIGIIVIFSAFRLKKSSVDMQMYMLNKGFDVITSYSIHYTKLYEVTGVPSCQTALGRIVKL